eukprot:Phypoly_transcript_10040.p1 GENE.Phypoly_transcript_10040~~Phypoly_transcript_10040.p1  ORF type:complete len:413 (+),score=54.79 Phypoly_transcript_10040:180-1241(+)
MATSVGGVLYFPSGSFVVTSTITLVTVSPYEVAGDGFSSTILWAFDGNLFSVAPTQENQAADLIFRDLRLHSTVMRKSPGSAAIYCVLCVRSVFSTLLIDSDDNVFPGSGIVMSQIADTNIVTNTQMWNIVGTGVRIDKGSEIRISDCRIIGDNTKNDSSIGVHVTGNNGGVHIDSTDIIALDTGVLLDDSNGQGSNREIFLTHATLDSCGIGLMIADSSYVSIAGCWAASSMQHNILIGGGNSAVLAISGGTIFNSGTYGCSNPDAECNGITVLSGTFILSGVEIRNNQGRGVWVQGTDPTEYVISGCRIFANGMGLDLAGTNYVINGNMCSSNQKNNSFVGSSSITANLGC